VQAELDERARLDEEVDALARGELPGLVLLGDPLRPGAEARLRAARLEALGEQAPVSIAMRSSESS